MTERFNENLDEQIAEREAMLYSELGRIAHIDPLLRVPTLLKIHNLQDGLQPLEAASIAGCLAHQDAIGHVKHRVEHSDDEKMRTRIIHTPWRDDATERDWDLYYFKAHLRILSIDHRLFGR